MRWSKKLLLSPAFKAKGRELKSLIRANDFPLSTRILILVSQPGTRDKLLFVPAWELKRHREEFEQEGYLAVGLAQDRESALEMAESVTKRALKSTGDPDAAAYLARRLKAGASKTKDVSGMSGTM